MNKTPFQKATFSSQSSEHVSRNSNVSNEMNDVAVHLNQLSCNSIKTSVPKVRSGGASWGEGFNLVGKGPKEVTKEKAPSGGWTAEAERTGKGGWEREKDACERRKVKAGWRGGKGQKKKCSLIDGFDEDMSADFVPYKRKSFTKTYKSNPAPSVYTQPDQKLRGTKHNQTTEFITRWLTRRHIYPMNQHSCYYVE